MTIGSLENSLIICPTSYKEKILEQMYQEKRICDVKFMDLKEFRRNWYFDYDNQAIKCLVDLGLSVNNSKEILENLYYIEDKKYNNARLDKLVEYKHILDKEKALRYNTIFKDYVGKKNIYVIGYGKLNGFDNRMLQNANNILKKEKEKTYIINCFKDIENEVEYIYNSIFDLIEEGIDINHIYIINANDDYSSYFKRFNTYYNFDIVINENDSLYGTKIAKNFLNSIETKTKEEIYEDLTSLSNENANSLINIINKYAEYDLKDVKALIIEDLKRTNLYKNELTDVVKCVKEESLFDEEDHVFLIGFNDSYPNLKKDIDYITDNIRPFVNLDSVEEDNKRIKENVRIYLSNIKNLHISYSENSPFNKYNKQTLFVDEKVNYVYGEESFEYSDELNKKKYADNLDKLMKYGLKDNDLLAKLYYLYKDNDYLTYSNKFTELNNTQLKEIEDINLSYSSMNNFYLCKFRYFIENILNIKETEGNFNTKLGSLCHYVLEQYYKDPKFDFDNCWMLYQDKYKQENHVDLFSDEKEEFFANKIKKELKEDINIIKEQKSNSLFDSVECENKFEFSVTNKAKFKGFIDKLLFNQKDGQTNVAVIDYKTGYSADIDTRLMEYGLSLQLPSYMYLLKKSGKFKDSELHFCGFYLQHIINNDYKYEDDELLIDKKKESMKLDGFTIDDMDLVTNIDTTLEPGKKSSNIKSIRLKVKDGFANSNRLISNETIDSMIQNVEDRINEAIELITKGDFSINPKVIKNQNKSCEYCPYGGICYKRNDDLNYINIEEEKE